MPLATSTSRATSARRSVRSAILGRRRGAGRLPEPARAALATADLAQAESHCPHGLPVAALVREACERLA